MSEAKMVRGDVHARVDQLARELAIALERIALLERQAKDWGEAFNGGKLPPPRQYESQFNVWPGAGNPGVR